MPALPQLPTLSDWLALLGGVYGTWGYPLVLVAAALENTLLVTFIFPGGTIVLLGGVYARGGTLELPPLILAGWIGTTLGASFDYAIGRWGTRTPLGQLIRHEQVAGSVDRAGDFLRRYGALALLGSHFIPQMRTFVAVAAGVTGLSYRRFLLYEAPAALAWSAVYAIGGYILADQIPLFDEIMRRVGWGFILVVAAFVAWKIRRQLVAPRSPLSPRDAPEAVTPP